MGKILMDELREIIAQSSSMSCLDKVVMLSLYDNMHAAYQQGILKKVYNRESLADSELCIILDCIAGISKLAGLPTTSKSNGEFRKSSDQHLKNLYTRFYN